MPSGARTMEQGRPLICGNIQGPTASRYCARSHLVTGLPSPAAGQSFLSGLEVAMPITTLLPSRAQSQRALSDLEMAMTISTLSPPLLALVPNGFANFVFLALAGISAST